MTFAEGPHRSRNRGGDGCALSGFHRHRSAGIDHGDAVRRDYVPVRDGLIIGSTLLAGRCRRPLRLFHAALPLRVIGDFGEIVECLFGCNSDLSGHGDIDHPAEGYFLLIGPRPGSGVSESRLARGGDGPPLSRSAELFCGYQRRCCSVSVNQPRLASIASSSAGAPLPVNTSNTWSPSRTTNSSYPS